MRSYFISRLTVHPGWDTSDSLEPHPVPNVVSETVAVCSNAPTATPCTPGAPGIRKHYGSGGTSQLHRRLRSSRDKDEDCGEQGGSRRCDKHLASVAPPPDTV